MKQRVHSEPSRGRFVTTHGLSFVRRLSIGATAHRILLRRYVNDKLARIIVTWARDKF
jgi:hypothetical protein